MTAFEIDPQTLNDLNIYSGENAEGSIYDFFNYSKTIGGRRKLKAMLLNPTNDIKLLTGRQEIIKFFLDKKINLMLVNFELEFIEDYLSLKSDPLKKNYIALLKLEMQRLFSVDNDYYKIQSGIRHLSGYLKNLSNTFRYFTKNECPRDLVKLIQKADDILSAPIILDLIAINSGKEISYLESIKFDKVLRKEQKNNLEFLLDLGYEFDAYQSIVQAMERNSLCFTEFDTESKDILTIHGLYHPNIKTPVKNDIYINESSNLFFLTGVNMSGKSSFLKALGLSVYLAHVGFPIPALKMRTKIFNGLITTLNLSDNIDSGYSHYYSEVVRVKKSATLILEKERIFVIFDELFKGTNAKDAYDASLLIISHLRNIKNSVFFLSSHILELGADLQKFENITCKCFEHKMIHNELTFDYRMVDGISTNGIGLYIVENEGIVEILQKAQLNDTLRLAGLG